jgi:DNA-binding LacI/PurR family transcriptional regulator
MRTANGKLLGRAAADIADVIRDDISSGRAAAGHFIPSVRAIAESQSVDRETVRRALKALEAEGLIAAEPRQGYRVLPGANDPDKGCPLAFVAGGAEKVRSFGSMGGLMQSLSEISERRGWPLLAIGTGGRAPQEIVAQVRAARSFGIALDVESPQLVVAVRQSRIPAVMVNAFDMGSGLDSVMQDGFLGGMLAVQHLLAQGCRRVAWFGNNKKGEHRADRYGGACAAMDDAGREFCARFEAGKENEDEKAREMLSGPDRPDGVVALWRSRSQAVVRAGHVLGLRPGRDLHVVGWCPEELYGHDYLEGLGGGKAPPVISFSIRTVAETTVARLTERRENPTLPPLRVKVPVRLRLSAGG